MDKTCVICNVTFNAKRSDAEVCSAKCRQKHWRNKIAKTSGPPSDDLYDELLKANEKIANQEAQLQQSLLLYNNQTAHIIKLEAENKRLRGLINEPSVISMTKISDFTKPTNVLKPQEQPITNFSINTIPEQKPAPTAAQALESVNIEARIAELEKELKNPPKNPVIGLTIWKRVREKELTELKNQLK